MTGDEAERFDLVARAILLAALNEDRAGELLEFLFDGGSCTIDPAGRLVLVDASVIAELGRGGG